jgi:hypothetical protein
VTGTCEWCRRTLPFIEEPHRRGHHPTVVLAYWGRPVCTVCIPKLVEAFDRDGTWPLSHHPP